MKKIVLNIALNLLLASLASAQCRTFYPRFVYHTPYVAPVVVDRKSVV